ncbi:hypothetical protein TRVA0_005S00738 [Trichomonascus vanleenenianus]|uniref:uncharacterized protein n=1 Tax=Trichomonascus vanleenenianus TaxID=2268995 RepID=UPI003ECA626B
MVSLVSAASRHRHRRDDIASVKPKLNAVERQAHTHFNRYNGSYLEFSFPPRRGSSRLREIYGSYDDDDDSDNWEDDDYDDYDDDDDDDDDGDDDYDTFSSFDKTINGKPGNIAYKPSRDPVDLVEDTQIQQGITNLDEDKLVYDSIVYSPYNNDRSCKDLSAVEADMKLISSRPIKSLRVYSTDCNALNNVIPTAKKYDIKVNQGLWIGPSGADSIDGQVNDLVNFGKANGWGQFTMVLVGNEAVLQNWVTAGQLVDKVRQVKERLRDAGYQGPISTSEPPVTYMRTPELCNNDVLDFVGINPHPFFDPGSNADSAGTFVAGQVTLTKQHCPNKKIYITETGYPSAGKPLGNNSPSPENQQKAIRNIVQVTNGYATFLTAFDDLWKDPGPWNIEQHFGILHLIRTAH